MFDEFYRAFLAVSLTLSTDCFSPFLPLDQELCVKVGFALHVCMTLKEWFWWSGSDGWDVCAKKLIDWLFYWLDSINRTAQVWVGWEFQYKLVWFDGNRDRVCLKSGCGQLFRWNNCDCAWAFEQENQHIKHIVSVESGRQLMNDLIEQLILQLIFCGNWKMPHILKDLGCEWNANEISSSASALTNTTWRWWRIAAYYPHVLFKNRKKALHNWVPLLRASIFRTSYFPLNNLPYGTCSLFLVPLLYPLANRINAMTDVPSCPSMSESWTCSEGGLPGL